MGKVATITKKNFKLVLRSKASAIIMMLGPVLLMFVIGLALNNTAESERINIGYISTGENNLTKEFVSVISVDQYVIERIKGVEECKEKIGAGKLHICIKFPDDFRITNDHVNEIDFYVDNSQVNLFRTVVDSMENKFNQKAKQLSTGMTTELITKLNQTSEEIKNSSIIIEELKEENRELSSGLTQVKNDIEDMDLEFNSQELRLEDLEDFQIIMRDYEEHTDDAIDETENLIDDIDDFIEEGNVTSSQEDELLELINSSQEDIEEIKDELNETNVDSSEKVRGLIDNLKDNVEDLDERLSDASTKKTSSAERIDELNSLAASSLSKISAVENVFNAITANIENTEITDVERIVNPIEKNIRPLVAQESQLNFYFPYLIVMVIMFVGVLLASNLVFMEKSSKAYFRNFVTPTKDFAFIASTFLTTFIMIVIQLIFVLLVFTLYFNKNILANWPVTSLVLFLASSVFTFIGILMGNLFNSNESNMLASISISSIMLFVSDLIYPLEKMPQYVAELATKYNPFYVSSDLLRRSIIHRVPFGTIADELVVLTLTLLLLVLLTWVTHKLMKQYFILKFSGYINRRNLRRTAEKQEIRRIHKNIKNLGEHNAFVTKNNKKIKNIKELTEFIRGLSNEDFTQYVNSEGNAFADWVAKNIADEELTTKLFKTKSRWKTISLFKRARRKFEKLDKKLQKETNKKLKNSS
ncbi:MAG: ABC transporter permease [Nanoarchaeota archaeon]